MSPIVLHRLENITVRTVQIDGKTYFVGKDAAASLGYANESDALTTHCRGVAKRYPIPDALGRLQDTRIIDEPDLMRLIVNSTLPTAERVERWVFEEVLPSIRETGSYSVTQKSPAELSRMEILQIAMDAEQGRLVAETQRDEAIRTKALIGSKREATAMAKASAATREAARLRDALGFSAHHATIIAVENKTDRKFGKQGYQPLRKYCKEHGLQPEKVHDPRWGEATAWPAVAWQAVYSIDLRELFPDAALEAA